MKKNINNPALRVIRFDSKDVIVTSVGSTDDNYYEQDPTLAPGRYNPSIWE